jgi:hypothetical protein
MEELNVYYIAYQTQSGIHWRITELNLDSPEGLLQWIDEEEKQGAKIVPIFFKKLDQ